MKGGLSLFRVRGIPVRADASWLVILSLVLWSLAFAYFPRILPGLGRTAYLIMGTLASLLFFGCVLLHELSHSLVARRFNLPVRGITLFVFGGVSEIAEEPQNPKVEFWMAIAGPLMSFALAGLSWGVGVLVAGAGGPAPVVAVLVYLTFINALLGAFNLVPGFPLDGGRILRSALWAWRGDLLLATRWSSYSGKGVAALLMALGAYALINGVFFGGIWYAFIGLFLWQAADSAYEQLMVKRRLQGLTVGQVMNWPAVSVPADISLATLVDDYIFRQRYGAYPVVVERWPIGMVSLHQLRQIPRDRWGRVTVQAVMTPVDEPLAPQTPLTDALKLLGARDERRWPVVEGGQLVGVISLSDIAAAMERAELRREARRPAA